MHWRLNLFVVIGVCFNFLVGGSYLYAEEKDPLPTFVSGQILTAEDLNHVVVVVKGLLEQNRLLREEVDRMTAKLRHMSVVEGNLDGLPGPHLIVEGVNLHVRSGSGATDDGITDADGNLTGLGNLIVGYNEPPDDTETQWMNRSGSHNLIVGTEHQYGSYGGAVLGHHNQIGAPHACVSGGNQNMALGENSSISGGSDNISWGEGASVSGGSKNNASAKNSSISGGLSNSTRSIYSSILGGYLNYTDSDQAGNEGRAASISGGHENDVWGNYASISGGFNNQARGETASVSGGRYNNANGTSSSIGGGAWHKADGMASTVSGGSSREAAGETDWVAGGLFQDF